MARSNALTDTHLRNAKWTGADQWLNDGGPRGAGRLVARVRAAGISFHFQYFSTDRKRRLITLGDYDRTGKRGLTLATARPLCQCNVRQLPSII